MSHGSIPPSSQPGTTQHDGVREAGSRAAAAGSALNGAASGLSDLPADVLEQVGRLLPPAEMARLSALSHNLQSGLKQTIAAFGLMPRAARAGASQAAQQRARARLPRPPEAIDEALRNLAPDSTRRQQGGGLANRVASRLLARLTSPAVAAPATDVIAVAARQDQTVGRLSAALTGAIGAQQLGEVKRLLALGADPTLADQFAEAPLAIATRVVDAHGPHRRAGPIDWEARHAAQRIERLLLQAAGEQLAPLLHDTQDPARQLAALFAWTRSGGVPLFPVLGTARRAIDLLPASALPATRILLQAACDGAAARALARGDAPHLLARAVRAGAEVAPDIIRRYFCDSTYEGNNTPSFAFEAFLAVSSAPDADMALRLQLFLSAAKDS